MRKHLSLIIGLSFALSSLMGQSSVLPNKANDDISVIVNDSLMFIGQNVDSLTEEQRYFNPIYLIVQKGKEYLKKQLICASVCDCDTTVPNKRIGIFSVAPNKYVSFSQGNLQYFPAANLWKFADNQYEYLGASNKYLSPTYRNWVDLFGWSGDSGKAPFGVSTSTDVADYKGDFVDWGTNRICGDAPDTWRTLSKKEWEYLMQERPMASSLYGMAQVIGINGIVLLPDKWLAPEGITFIPGGHTNDGIGYFSQHQSFSVEQWRLLEESGAVFLPAAGIFISPNNFITAIEEGAHYYTSNQYDEDNAYWFGFRSSYYTINYNKKHMRRSVRLVHDTIISFEPEYVDLGLSVKWATCNVGATQPEEYGDHFAWGETQPKDEYSWANYKWCDGTDQNITKYNTTDGLTTLLPEDDAAHINWGGEWRMPTGEEMKELYNFCTWERINTGEHKGYRLTSKINGNSIFLPAAGFKNELSHSARETGNDIWSSSISGTASAKCINFINSDSNHRYIYTSFSRFMGFSIRPVLPSNRDLSPNDDKVTITIHATPSDATVSLLCLGYTREGNSITVDKGKSVLYLVSNVADGYLSQGDSLLNLTRDTTLYINLEPFSDGIWETVNDSLLEHTPNCYISRNNCGFAKYDSWSYYVMPATEGEIYRIQTIAGQHAAPWIAVSTPPDFATLTRAKQIACSPIKGPAGYLAEEFVVPEGTNYVIINYRKSSTNPLVVEKKVTDIQPVDANSYTLVHGNDYNPLFCDSTDRASIMPYTIFIPTGVTIAPKSGYQWGYYTDVDTLNMPSGKLQYKWTTDSYVGEGKPVGITIKKDNGVFDFTSDSRYAKDYFYTSDPSIWIKSSSED